MNLKFQWRSKPKVYVRQKSKCLTLGEQQYFCLGRHFTKHKMTRYVKNFGAWPLGPPGYAFVKFVGRSCKKNRGKCQKQCYNTFNL